MLKSLIIPKEDVVIIPDSMNCWDAVELLESYNLRNAPVVDDTFQMYRGNIYRYHIYKYAFHNPEADLKTINVTHFLKNTTHVIHESDTLFELIFAIQDLPYIVVLNDQNSFSGIIRHHDLLQFLAHSLGADQSNYVLGIQMERGRYSLAQLSRIISKYVHIESLVSFKQPDPKHPTQDSCLLVIDGQEDMMQINALIHKLRRKKYQVNFAKII